MNVATTNISAQKTTSTLYNDIPSTPSVIDCAMVCRRPDELTDLPSARPPAASMMIVQRKLLKSSFVRMPVPKKRTRGIMATTPMSPKTGSSWWLTHQRMMVTTVTMLMKYWTPVNLSLSGRIGTMVVPRPGWKVTRRRSQIRTMEMMQTGSATKNHTPQEGSGCMFWRAMRFWGEAIGEAAPPMLEERAMPRRSALVIFESAGRLRRMGCLISSWLRSSSILRNVPG